MDYECLRRITGELRSGVQVVIMIGGVGLMLLICGN